MNDEIVKQIIAFVIKRNGKKEISESDIYLTLSLQLQWCPPTLAKQFIQRAIQDGFLMKNNELLSATFPMNDINIPIGFKPEISFFESYKPQQSSLDSLVKQDFYSYIISNSSSKDDLEKQIESIMAEKNVSKSVALLLYAKKNDISYNEYLNEIETTLFI